jgi:hypothetical protein
LESQATLKVVLVVQALLQAISFIRVQMLKSAIVIISEIFGFSSELARQMLGTPKITTEVTEPINE